MSLLAAIPGLSAHDGTVTKPAPLVVSFDADAARKVIQAAICEVALAFPAPDPFEWLRVTRPEVLRKFRESTEEMQAAFVVQDLELLKVAAARFVKLHLWAWKLYELRPPVIEVQGDLL